MSVTKNDILAIRPGRTKVFKVDKPQAIKSAMVMCTYIKNMRLIPEGVERYTCSSDYTNLYVVITAVRKRKEVKDEQ
jgi:hypothetical protein